MPLAADLSCPRCGPRTVSPTHDEWHERNQRAAPLVDASQEDEGACEYCGYHVHASTCRTLEPQTPYGWTRESCNQWRHSATGCTLQRNQDGANASVSIGWSPARATDAVQRFNTMLKDFCAPLPPVSDNHLAAMRHAFDRLERT